VASEDIVTLKDVYQSTQAIAGTVAKMEGDLKAAVDARTDHEDRLRALEKWMYALPPTLLLAAASLLLALLK
jgi:hypothetical protein